MHSKLQWVSNQRFSHTEWYTPKQPGMSIPKTPRFFHILARANLFRAYGFFECTHDCTDITSASFLNTMGKKTDVLLRVSTVGPESGSADTSRDVHGWGMKLYTDEGNLDWVFNNTVRGTFGTRARRSLMVLYHIAYFLCA